MRCGWRPRGSPRQNRQDAGLLAIDKIPEWTLPATRPSMRHDIKVSQPCSNLRLFLIDARTHPMQLPDLRAGLTSLASRARARSLCIAVPFVSPAMDNSAVMALFSEHKDLIGLPVIEAGTPFGMINRHIFLSQMARPFFRELYDRKSCIAFMDKDPLVIDADTELDQVAQQVVASGDK